MRNSTLLLCAGLMLASCGGVKDTFNQQLTVAGELNWAIVDAEESGDSDLVAKLRELDEALATACDPFMKRAAQGVNETIPGLEEVAAKNAVDSMDLVDATESCRLASEEAEKFLKRQETAEG